MAADTKICPYCSEEIKATAIRCRYCQADLTQALAQSPGRGTEAQFLAVGSIIGTERFEIVRYIGRGGMGDVYEAVHRFAEKRYAIKALFPEEMADVGARKRFLDEGRTLASLKHENIVEFGDVFVDNGRFYLAMEYIEGRTLTEVLGAYKIQDGLAPIQRVVAWTRGVLKALQHAHSQTPVVVHRDIKPANVMVRSDGRIVVMDFGIAKVLERDTLGGIRSVKGTVTGTCEYMSPEQCNGDTITPASDVYSAGILAYEMLTGEVPFPARAYPGIARLLDAQRTLEPPPVLKGRPDCPAWMGQLVHKALRKSPAERFKNGGEMLAALEAGLEGRAPQPIAVRPPSPAPVVTTSEAELAETQIAPATPKPPVTPTPVVVQHKVAPVPNVLPDDSDTATGIDQDQPNFTDQKPFFMRPLVWAPAAIAATALLVWVVLAAVNRPQAELPQAELPPADAAVTDIEWVTIPGGSFEMGSYNGDDDEKPVHTVKVDTFEMAKTEVTVAQYRKCVDAGVCTAPDTGDYCNWGKADRSDHPVNCVDWYQATAYAKWVGGRLPIEAEWEYAGRSGGKNRKYTWGNEEADCSRVVMDYGGDGCGRNSTWSVCSKTAGNTDQGLCDMAGNVWEWCSDWYDNSYYANSPSNNPTGPASGSLRVYRGGSWSNDANGVRPSNRFRRGPAGRYVTLGFRPVRSK